MTPRELVSQKLLKRGETTQMLASHSICSRRFVSVEANFTVPVQRSEECKQEQDFANSFRSLLRSASLIFVFL